MPHDLAFAVKPPVFPDSFDVHPRTKHGKIVEKFRLRPLLYPLHPSDLRDSRELRKPRLSREPHGAVEGFHFPDSRSDRLQPLDYRFFDCNVEKPDRHLQNGVLA